LSPGVVAGQDCERPASLPGRGLFLRVLIAQTGPVAERLRVREIDDDVGRRLVRIVRRDSGSVVTWRRAQMVLLSAQGMDAAAIAEGRVHQRGPGPRCDPQLQR
jgi:hypothetical protein